MMDNDDQMFWCLAIAICFIPWIAVGISPVSQSVLILLFIEVSAVVGLTMKQWFGGAGPEDISTIVFAGFGLLIAVSSALAAVGLLTASFIAAAFELILIGTVMVRRLKRFSAMTFTVPHRAVVSSIAVALVGLAFAVYVKLNSPYPLQIDTDIIKEAIRVDAIAAGGHAPLFFGTLRPVADDTLIAAVALMTHSSPYFVEWVAPFAIFVLYGLGTLFVAKRFFGAMSHGSMVSEGGWLEATIAGIFATAICGFWSFEGPAIVDPAEIAIVVMLFLIAFYMDWERAGWGQLVDIVMIMAVVSVGYYYIIPFALPLIALLQAAPRQRLSGARATRNAAIIASLSLAILVVSLLEYGGAYGQPISTYSLAFIAQYLFAAYSPIVLLLTFVGIAAIWGRNVAALTPILLYTLLAIMMIFVPLAFSNRLESFGRADIAIVAAFGLSRLVTFAFSKNSHRMKFAAAGMMLLVSTPLLVAPYQSWVSGSVDVPTWGGLPMAVMSQDEGQAALWLASQGSQGGFVVSDIETSAIMQAVSGLPGMYDPLQFLSNATTIVAVYDALATTNSTQVVAALHGITYGAGIKPSHFYIVFSSRTQQSVATFRSIGVSGGTTIAQAVDSPNILTALLIYYPTYTTAFPTTDLGQPAYRNPTVEIFNVTV